MSAELLPCPFCDDPMEAFVATPEGCARGKELFWVVCDHCGAMGGTGNSVDGAIAAWNTRATQPQAPQGAVTGWQPIETAPKDGGNILVFVPMQGSIRGYWQADKYAAKPRPYWTTDWEHIGGKLSARQNQPTHWMPLPADPETPEGKK